MLRWQQLATWPEQELARLDIAAVNLACANGLPGADRIDWEKNFTTLDRYADSCQRFTAGVMPHFYAGRGDYPESEPKHRIQAMVTHLQRDLGVRYHPDRIAEDSMHEPEDKFVYGIIQGEGGTCANMPVLYAAVGRRMGYPIKLARAWAHVYCRWDEGPGGDSFNIEATGHGASFVPDDHYRTGRYTAPPGTEEAWGLLKSLTPREELSGFLSQRALVWGDLGNHREAAVAFAWAQELDPTRRHYTGLAMHALQMWREEINRELPTGRRFPLLDILYPPPLFRSLPREFEFELIGLMATRRLLDTPILDVRWWTPLRLNPYQRPASLPDQIPVEFRWTVADRGVTIFPTFPEIR
jgi:hypothetical protein